jgi:UDP-galactopyranose mutase
MERVFTDKNIVQRSIYSRKPSEFPIKKFTIICFSHLRWNFVLQRPQHLMRRFAETGKVVFWEEPEMAAADTAPELRIEAGGDNVMVVTPRLPQGLNAEDTQDRLAGLLCGFARGLGGEPVIRWYYTPMMLPFSRDLPAACTVYDCMDELANFKFAPPELIELETQLLSVADLVFTGGYSLYEAKRQAHRSVHPFPSSVEQAHFARAREARSAAGGEADRRAPTLGFFGVIDERMDIALLAGLARARPDWTLELIGPVVKNDQADLPRGTNIRYLGPKRYDGLPLHAAAWDVALMPFAINDATRFISPTKTPEYLAAGLPVVSTPIRDVVRDYGGIEAVEIAGDLPEFVAACERALVMARDRDGAWLAEADRILAGMSWDITASRMAALMSPFMPNRRPAKPPARHFDYLIVGAGFAGSVMAERLAADGGKRVLLIDRRDHVGGNAFDMKDEAGILIHKYGPHIFHTNSEEIVDYLSRFTAWRPYEHRVLADIEGVRVPMPINRTTLNRLYGLALETDAEVEAFLASRALRCDSIQNSEDVVVSRVGRDLYETFFRGYTRKQWGIDPAELDKSVTSRVPVRTCEDDRYFTDRFQAMPADGYTAMFERMLDHPLIDIRLGVDFEQVKARIFYDRLVYTGPIDEYFGYCFGKLPYRSLEFRHETKDTEWFQPTAVVNYPSEAIPYTRVTEYKHLTGQVAPKTSVTYEFPRADGDPYYPVPRPENQRLFDRYKALADRASDVLFVGRLATYRYYNMDQIVGQALATYRRHKAPVDRTARRRPSERDIAAVAAE